MRWSKRSSRRATVWRVPPSPRARLTPSARPRARSDDVLSSATARLDGPPATKGSAPWLAGTPITATARPASGRSMKSFVRMTSSLAARGADGPGTGHAAVGVGPPPIGVERPVVEGTVHGDVEGRPGRLVVGECVPEALLEDPFVAVPADADVADVELRPLVGRADRLRLRDGESVGQRRDRIRGVAGRDEDEIALAAEALGLDVLREDDGLGAVPGILAKARVAPGVGAVPVVVAVAVDVVAPVVDRSGQGSGPGERSAGTARCHVT